MKIHAACNMLPTMSACAYLVLNRSCWNIFFGFANVNRLSSIEPIELWSNSCWPCSSSGVYWSSVADGKWCSDRVITRGGVDTRTGLVSVGNIELSNIISRGAVRVPAIHPVSVVFAFYLQIERQKKNTPHAYCAYIGPKCDWEILLRTWHKTMETLSVTHAQNIQCDGISRVLSVIVQRVRVCVRSWFFSCSHSEWKQYRKRT